MARQRGNRWQADVLLDGKRHRPSFPSQEEAEAYERSIARGIPAASAVTLGPFIETHFEFLWGDLKAPETARKNLKTLVGHFGPDKLLADIRSTDVVLMIGELKRQGLKNSTINRKLSALSKLLKFAREQEVLGEVPVIRFQRETGGRDRVISEDEEVRARQWFAHMGLTKSGALFDFLLETGCRWGEAAKLTRASVANGRVTFRDRKNGSTGIVPLTTVAKGAWETICKASNHDRPFGDAIPRKTFYGHWRMLQEHLGTTDDPCFVPHILRHTCCTRLVVGGVPLTQVMQWMGHKSIQTTMRYSHLAPKDLDVALRVLERAA